MVTLSADLEVQLDQQARAGYRPVVAMLVMARRHAATAMEGLVLCDAHDAKSVQSFQNEVRRYDDLVTWARKIIDDGRDADRTLAEEERAEISNLLLTPEGRAEASALGINDEDIE